MNRKRLLLLLAALYAVQAHAITWVMPFMVNNGAEPVVSPWNYMVSRIMAWLAS